METVKGLVEFIRYRNQENGFTVLNIVQKDNMGRDVPGSRQTLVGVMPEINEGMSVEATGEMVVGKYGPNIKVSSIQEVRPTDEEGIERYLGSGLIKFVGPVFAKKIVKTFGEKTLDILDNEPERLAEIKGIGKKRVLSVIESVKEQKGIREVMIWLKRYDLPNGLSAKIYKAYENNSISVLEENPYKLYSDIRGVGFKTADSVAIKLGFSLDDPRRLRAGVLFTLENASVEGHVCLPMEELVKKAASERVLSVEPEGICRVVDDMLAEDNSNIVFDGGMVYLRYLYRAEMNVAGRIQTLLSEKSEPCEADLSELQEKTGVTYDDVQAEAIEKALREKVVVITGGPGTGKTVTTQAIIAAFEGAGKRVLLAAPTGRAAKRMSEVTGREAQTIHRLLEWQGGFTRNRTFPLSADVVVVDESSMIDVELMSSLLDAVPDEGRVVLVGDMDQLPSVGPGSVLRDIILSGAVPTVRLTRIFRQAQGSAIVMNAHAVNNGHMPVMDNRRGTNFWFNERRESADVADTVIKLMKEVPERMGFDRKNIQVLCPMRRTGDPIGSTELNARLQQELNPDGKAMTAEGKEFREGDRVMQIRNNYDKEVYNGDIGTVCEVDPVNKTVAVYFDGDDKYVFYEKKDIPDLELAYACTIHKSQGSEYDVVIMPIHRSQYIMLKRNLLYTGITRAKKFVFIVGTKDAVGTAVSREDTSTRYSRLKEILMVESRV